MRTYAIRRLVLILPTLLLVTMIVFLTVRLIPGNVVDAMYTQMLGSATGYVGTSLDREYERADIERILGLDVPIHVQYVRWMGFAPTPDPQTGESRYIGIFQGNLGESIWENDTVVQAIASRLPITIELGILGLALALMIAFPVGIWSAIRQDRPSDYAWRTMAIIFISVPGFWLGTMVVVYPSIWWGWSPPMQYIHFADDLRGNLGMNLIPAVLLGMALSGTTMRMTRTMMLEVLRQDYIRTAWSKGLKERTVIIRHALKNALIPVVTIVGMQLPILIGGTVIIEQIFNIPGIGRLMVRAIGQRDYPIISGLNLMIAAFVLLTNMVIDLTYAYLDPRVQYK